MRFLLVMIFITRSQHENNYRAGKQSPVNPILDRVPQSLYPCQQPCGDHGDTEGTDENSQHRKDNAGHDSVCQKHVDRTYPHEDAGYAEHPTGDVENTGAEPDKDCQYSDYGRSEYFQQQLHHADLLLFVLFSVSEERTFFKDAVGRCGGGSHRDPPRISSMLLGEGR